MLAMPMLRHAAPLQRSLCALPCLRAFGAAADIVEISVVDPRWVLEPGPAGSPEDPTKLPSVQLRVPRGFLATLAHGVFALGDADSPESSWTFGESGELFELQYQGSVRVPSGFAGVLETGRWRGGSQERLGAWKDLKEQLTAGEEHPRFPLPGYPFLFVGRVVEAATASVFVKRGAGGAVRGVVLASDTEEAD